MNPAFPQILSFIRKLYNQPEGVIPLHSPVFGGNELKYLEECIRSTYVSSVGRFVDEFEKKMAEYTGAKKAVVCVNGTNALYLALKLVGVERDTEVITQPLTFIATANAITYCGASPVFLDVDEDTLGLSPKALRSWLETNTEPTTHTSSLSILGLQTPRPNNVPSGRQIINKRTKKRITACVPVHTFGHPCRIDEIVEICNEYNIPVIEDAAESLGSFFMNQHTGTFGEIGVLSFNGNKILTTGGGGMLLFKDENLAKRAKHLTTQAKIPHPWEFEHDEIGFNYRMPNINAALGLAQLEQLPRFLESKRRIAQDYIDFFNQLNTPPPAPQPSNNEQRTTHLIDFHSGERTINTTPELRSIWRANKKTPHPNDIRAGKYQTTNNEQQTIKIISEPPNSRSNYWLNCILLPDREMRDEFLAYSNQNGVTTRPAWKMMNELIMFEHCETDRLVNAKKLSDRIVNLPSSVIFS